MKPNFYETVPRAIEDGTNCRMVFVDEIKRLSKSTLISIKEVWFVKEFTDHRIGLEKCPASGNHKGRAWAKESSTTCKWSRGLCRIQFSQNSSWIVLLMSINISFKLFILFLCFVLLTRLMTKVYFIILVIVLSFWWSNTLCSWWFDSWILIEVFEF